MSTTEHRAVPARVDPRFNGGMAATAMIDVGGLRKRLEATITGEVRFDTQSKALYATDASNYRQVPIGVVVPKTLDDVVATHRACHEFGAPIVNRGGGTSLSGETVNFAVVIDHSKYLTEIGDADAETRTVTCQPGAINEQRQREDRTAGRTWSSGPIRPPTRAARSAETSGNNSCGIHSVQAQLYGPGPRTSDNVEALEIVTYDGARFWVGSARRTSSTRSSPQGGRKGEIYAQLRDLRDRYADLDPRPLPAGRPTAPPRLGLQPRRAAPERGFNVARALVGTESHLRRPRFRSS